MKLDLKRRWKGFKKRSWQYQLAVVYAFIGICCFILGFYTIRMMATTYNDVETSFMIETSEQLRVVGFFTMVLVIGGISSVAAIFCWFSMFVLLLSDRSKRLKRIEEFLEEDGVFNFRKDEE